MQIVFVYFWLDFDGDTLKDRPLGGVETSIVIMAKELAKLGFSVTVFNKCSRPGVYDGVIYSNTEKLQDYLLTNNIDILIEVRSATILGCGGLRIKRRIFWSGDPIVFFDEARKNLRRSAVQSVIDKYFFVSKWQANSYQQNYNLEINKIFVTRNGFEKELIDEKNIEACDHRMIYASVPDRGLALLEHIFPLIKKTVPEAELHVFSGYEHYQMNEADIKRVIGDLFVRLSKIDGVFLHKVVSRKELMAEFKNSSFLIYPCTALETSCMVAIEAQACGIPVLASSLGGLPETVQDGKTGIIVPGSPESQDFITKFAEEAIKLIQDKELRDDLGANAKKRMFDNYQWTKIAKEWEAVLSNILQLSEVKHN
ncbi:MAG: glycosyltransferase family 4 protein [Candidatus Margulisiibacteriota bacterium]